MSQIILKLAVLFVLAAGVVRAQEPSDEMGKRFTLKLTLTPNDLIDFRRNGFLKAKVPPKMVNRVAAVKLLTNQTFLARSLDVDAEADRLESNLLMVVDESVLSRLEFQPVLMKIYHSGYSNVVLRYRPTLKQIPPKKSNPLGTVDVNDSKQFVVRLNKNRSVVANIRNFKSFQIDSDFGKVDISTDKVDGIKFNAGKPGQVFVILKSGDAFSGKIDLNSVTVRTQWGDHQIKASDLDSLTNAINVTFAKDPNKPEKWKLVVKQFQQPATNRPRWNPGNPNVPMFVPQPRLPAVPPAINRF